MSGSINEAERLRPKRNLSAFSRWAGRLGPLLIALCALLSMRPSLDAVGELPDSADAPGLTLDEIFNIQTGVHLWRSLILEGPGYFTPGGAERVFNQPLANPDHPPFGRLVIGAAHDLLRPSVGADDPRVPAPYSVLGARSASALLFALTVWLVGRYSALWYGSTAGVVASISLLLMPRAFGHAHLAALETAIGLMFSWTVLYAAEHLSMTGGSRSLQALRSDRLQPVSHPAPLPWRAAIIAGVLLGLALLTKIQAILLPIPIGLWCVWQHRSRAIPLMMIFGGAGVAVFFLGWPWLWLDPIGHTLQYLGRTTERPTLYCHYLGQRYADIDVPWHYSFVMFVVTVPVGLQLLGGWGGWRFIRPVGWAVPTNNDGHSPSDAAPLTGRDPRAALVAAVILFVLTFFALPGITVYDGERLFLVAFPLWAVLINAGFHSLFSRVDNVSQDHVATASLRKRAMRGPLFAAVLLVVGVCEGVYGLVHLHPCHLSYYSCAVGGLSGADRIGFEATYWRDSFTRRFLEDVAAAVPHGSTLYVAPVLHPANRIDLPLLSPILQQHNLQTDSYDDKDPAKRDMRYVLVFRRHADPWASLEPAPAGAKLLCEFRRDGVQLAALYDLSGK